MNNFFFPESFSYLSIQYFFLIGIGLILYYLLPQFTRIKALRAIDERSSTIQWVILLIVSMIFYWYVIGKDSSVFLFFLGTVLFSYLAGLIISRTRDSVFSFRAFVGLETLALVPLVLIKISAFIEPIINHDMENIGNIIAPIGLSFYTLQIYAYLYDVHKGKIDAELNPLKYLLFISFFPHIVQGPIARFGDLRRELFKHHEYDEEGIAKGFQLIVWGFFMKYMIADRAGVFVDEVFEKNRMYLGVFVLIAGILYSIQLYTDFLSCVCISRGVAESFGIRISDNFARPYLSTSIKDFWRRWHISLSSWLRDYVYIPLGGNRKGKLRKNLNLMLTFLVSGFWHGNGYNFLFWGGLHGVYQLGGGIAETN